MSIVSPVSVKDVSASVAKVETKWPYLELFVDEVEEAEVGPSHGVLQR